MELKNGKLIGLNSVTPLKANFMHALGGKKGEINL